MAGTIYGLPSGGGLSPLLREYLEQDSGQAFAAKMDAGTEDVVLAIMGDSTGNASDEWVRLTVDTLAAAHPASRVVYVPWDSATEAYGAPVEVQAGDVPATGVVFRDTFTRTGDVYGSTPDLGPVWGGYGNTVGDWTMNGTDAVRTEDATSSELIADTGVGGDMEFRLDATVNTLARSATKLFRLYMKYLDSNNSLTLQLSVYADGTTGWQVWQKIAGTTTVLGYGSTTAVAHKVESAPFAASLRFEGVTVTATVNTDVRTWTLDTATAEALRPATKAAITGSVTPAGTLGDRLHSFEAEALGVGTPEQTVTVYNASEPGSRLDYQSARLATVLPEAPDLAILSSCHNYGSTAPAAYVSAVEAFVDQVRDLHPGTGIAVSSQNPQKSPAANRTSHAARLVALRTAALRKGWGYVPAFEAFRAQADRGESLIAADGVHPTAAGSALWEDAATSFLNGLSRKP